MDSQSLIRLDSVSKFFDIHIQRKLPSKRTSSTMDGFDSLKKYTYPALNNISLDIKKGDWIGVIGKNGSGKSTLMKILSGIHTPEKGTVDINGSILPFFGADEILHPEGTVKDSILVKAIQVGLPKNEALKIYHNIIAFSELEDFTSQKIKFLSSGMKTRLMLGLMLNINADIYLFDEIPATTDMLFQEKVMNRILKLKQLQKTALIISHNMEEIKKYCEKSILLNDGEIVSFDRTDNILKLYAEN